MFGFRWVSHLLTLTTLFISLHLQICIFNLIRRVSLLSSLYRLVSYLNFILLYFILLHFLFFTTVSVFHHYMSHPPSHSFSIQLVPPPTSFPKLFHS